MPMHEPRVFVSPSEGNSLRVRLTREAARIALDAIAPDDGPGTLFPQEAFEALMEGYFSTEDEVIEFTLASDEEAAESLTALFAALGQPPHA